MVLWFVDGPKESEREERGEMGERFVGDILGGYRWCWMNVTGGREHGRRVCLCWLVYDVRM